MEEQQKNEAEQKENRKKTFIKVGIVAAVIVIILILATLFMQLLLPNVIIPAINANKYKQAISLEEIGEYNSAYKLFVELDDYMDSVEHATNIEKNESTYEQAIALSEEGKLSSAYKLFIELGNYMDSSDHATVLEQEIEAKYNSGCEQLESNKFQEAYDIFVSLDDYKDSQSKADEAYNHFKSGVFTEARIITVGTDLDGEFIYHPARSKNENVSAEITLSYSNGVPSMNDVTVVFTSHVYGGTVGGWSESKFKYVGDFKNNTITGNGKLYQVYWGKEVLIYSGGFYNGSYSGYGNYYWNSYSNNDDQIFIYGSWRNGNINGKYARYYQNGSVNDKGYVVDDVIHSDKYGDEDCSYLMPESWPDSVNQ